MVTIAFANETDRRSFLRGAALVGLAGFAGAAVLQRRDAPAIAQSSDVDVDLMNLGITFESLLSACYERLLATDMLTERDRAVLTPAAAHQSGYRDVLRAGIERYGGTAVEEPQFHFDDSDFATREAGLGKILELENMVLQGWQGQMRSPAEPTIVHVLRPIALAKPTHAAAIAVLLQGSAQPFPAAIEPALTLPEALEAVEEYRGS
jgi:Ferritin-like domain